MSSHENKIGCLNLFSIKNIFYDKLDLGFFILCVTKCCPIG